MPGGTFVALPGYRLHGNKFIPEALSRGALHVVVHEGSLSDDLRAMIARHGASIREVENPRRVLAELSAESYNYPAKKIIIIGITGTKGKTTTAYLLEHILKVSGIKTALLGSVCNRILDEEEKSLLTTCESDYLHTFFHTCIERHVDVVVMEVSAHGPALYRTHGIPFSYLGFTNLMPDHLDFFHDMENYFQAKLSLFDQLSSAGVAVVNDTLWGRRVAQRVERNGQQTIIMSSDDISAVFFNAPALIGDFNKENCMLAVGLCQSYGLSNQQIQKALLSFSGVPGRLQLHTLQSGAKGFVDFAHNGPAVEKVLGVLRKLTSHLIVLFGCGGDRDPSRRPAMGRAVVQYADEIILTNDNARSEDPMKIVNDILVGIDEVHYSKIAVILDRRDAIKAAANRASKDSILVLLGRGHESTQIVGDRLIELNDFDELSCY